MNLLVVDDDPSVREALALVLGHDGFDVGTAIDGHEAIRILAAALEPQASAVRRPRHKIARRQNR
jgi:DNA-binding response OmpR family regulator